MYETYSLFAFKVGTCFFVKELILLIILSFVQLCPIRAIIESTIFFDVAGSRLVETAPLSPTACVSTYFSAVPQSNVYKVSCQ